MGTVFHMHQERDLVVRCTAMLDVVLRVEAGAGEVRELAAMFDNLVNHYGQPGIAFALRTWCDLLIAATPGARPGQLVRVAFLTANGGIEAEPADPAHQWASDVAAAKLAGNELAFYCLTEELPDDHGDRAEFVLRLVEMVAHALNAERDLRPAGPGHVKPGLYQRNTAAS